jgi:hypothetical protein
MPKYTGKKVKSFVMIENEAYAVDTHGQILRAERALCRSGAKVAKVWHGHPGDSSSYPGSNKLFCRRRGK